MKISKINSYSQIQHFQGKKLPKSYKQNSDSSAQSAVIDDILEEIPVPDESKKMLSYYLFFDDKRAKSIKALLAFASGKIVKPEIFLSGQCASKINENAQGDIDKLIEIYKNDRNPEESFVPCYKDEKEAQDKSKTGEVFRIQNRKNIHIKTKEGKSRELYITPKKYLELFPPVERYSVQQGYIGDCFILATLDSMYANPNSRERILECFFEDNKGNISACLGGYEKIRDKVKRKDKKRYYFANASTILKHDDRETSLGSKGIKILEMLIRREKEANAQKRINAQLIKFSKLNEEIKDAPYIKSGEYNYYRQEIENFLKLEQDAFNNPDDEEKQLFSFEDSFAELSCSVEEDRLYDEDEGEDDFENYANAVSNRINDYFRANNLVEFPVGYILPIYGISDLTGVGFDSHDAYISNGGYPSQVFDMFGITNRNYDLKTEKDELCKILRADDFNSKYVMTGYTPTFAKKPIYSKEHVFDKHHAYSISPFLDENKNLKLSIRNPHNSLFASEIDYDEFCDLFEAATVGKI